MAPQGIKERRRSGYRVHEASALNAGLTELACSGCARLELVFALTMLRPTSLTLPVRLQAGAACAQHRSLCSSSTAALRL